MMYVSTENASVQSDTDVASPQNFVATDLEEIDPFPFLDFPKDIRLCVYGNLLTRSLEKIIIHDTLHLDHPPSKVTFIG